MHKFFILSWYSFNSSYFFIFVIEYIKKRCFTLYAALADGKNDYDREKYSDKTAIIIGNESRGLSGKISCLADKGVRIPMYGKTESLNAAVAASILMFESRIRDTEKKSEDHYEPE